MKIIVPCAGRSSRFPNMSPKWMLPDHDGRPMVLKAVQGLNVSAQDLIVTILKEHEDKFDAVAGLKHAFGESIRCVILDEPTRSQSETVAETLRQSGIDEPFLIKDSDNYFEIPSLEKNFNYVSVASLNDFSKINPQNKSYVQIDQEDIIINFREKKVISDLFSVGGYYFTDPSEFLKTYEEMQSGNRLSPGELYLSEIIAFMAMNGHVFKARRVSNYEDWGTIHEWREKLERHRVFLVAIDGFLFEQGSHYFSPPFKDVKPHPVPIESVKALVEEGHKIRYLTVRPSELESLTRAQLAKQGLPDAPILFDCDIAQWMIVTAPHPNLPFRTSDSIEMAVDDPNMVEKLGMSV
jgi:hypothetical protein